MRMFIMLLLFPFAVFAQPATLTQQEKKADEKAKEVVKFFNAKQYDSLYALMAPSFQEKIPLKAFKNSMETQLGPYGSIVSFEFKSSRGGISKYKTQLKTGLLLQTLIGLDEAGMVSTFAMQPYKDDAAPKRKSLYSNNPLLSAVDSAADAAAKAYLLDSATAGMSIGIVWKGREYLYAYGEADVKNNTKASAQTVYEIGSITKTFLGYLLAKSVVSGKIKLHDPITKYLPDSVAQNTALAGIEVVHLANHTSGLPRLPADLFFSKGANTADPYAHYNDTLLFKGLKYLKPDNKPGEQFAYSNYAMGVLATILSRIYGNSFPELVAQFITEPLGMQHTTAANRILPMQATGYTDKMLPTPYWNFQSLAGAGSIKSTVPDMLRYGRFMNRTLRKNKKAGQLLSAITRAEHPMAITLAWMRTPEGESPARWEHGGGTYGFRSHIILYPEKEMVVVVLANQGIDPGASKVAYDIAARLVQMP